MSLLDLSKSAVQNLRQSPTQGRLQGRGQVSLLANVFGIVPVWGYGTFASGSTYGNLQYNDIWPVCYQTLTETIDYGGGNTTTNVTTWQAYWDHSKTSSSSFTGNPIYFTGFGTVASFTVGTTTFTATDTSGNIYTATVSSLATPNWSSLATQATALLAHQTLPTTMAGLANTPTNYPYNYFIAPKSVSPGWETIGATSTLMPAAMHGLPMRFNTAGTSAYIADTGNKFSDFLEAMPTILAGPPKCANAYASYGGVPNLGCVISLKSAWYMRGQYSAYTPWYGQGSPIYALWQQLVTGLTASPPTAATGITSPYVFPVDAFYAFDPSLLSGPGILGFGNQSR